MKQNNIGRRSFLKSSALLASIGPFAQGAAPRSSRAPGPEIFFTRDEYITRWTRVQAAMTAAGYENLLVWQRSASAYDRIGDVYWLTNFYTNGTGQDPYSEELDEPWTFAAVLMRKGHEPELHIGLPEGAYDAAKIFCGKVVTHTPHQTLKFAEYLRAEKIRGRVAVVGDDVLPGKLDRILRANTPKIEWVADDTFLEAPQLIKSPRELEAFHTAGTLVTDALNVAMEALISGERACEAAGRAAAVIMRGGGGFHRISIAHGPALQRPLSFDFYGYNMTAPSPGDVISMWIYGPIFAGYWLDPGRTAICAKRPTGAQKTLVESGAKLVDDMVKAVVPGMTARELGLRWAEIARSGGYFDAEKDEMFGHGLGASFPAYVLPTGDSEIGPFGYKRLQGPIKPGMVLAAEAFLTRPGVGVAAFERNFVVTATGVEVLDKTPMLFW
ncbi:MAG: M24 family metallopeptidase [Proteobacteria bacterium]|nr:M24 family metallopeptidase [Pseudomonadota bacterium]